MRARKEMSIIFARDVCVYLSRTEQAVTEHSMQYKIHRSVLFGISRQFACFNSIAKINQVYEDIDTPKNSLAR